MAYNYNNYPSYGQPTYVQTPYSGQGYQTAQPMNQMSQTPVSQMVPSQQSNSIKWVQGEAAARSYPLNPGESALLMDSDAPVLYAKTVDVYGRPMPMEVYDLVKRDTVVSSQSGYSQAALQGSSEQYVKVSDLEDKINELIRKALDKRGE